MGEALQNTPFIDLYRPGDKLMYDTFNITFFVDEDLLAWKDIHDWIRGMTFPKDFTEYSNLPRLARHASDGSPLTADATVSLLTSANNLNYRLMLRDCFPTSLSSVIFSSADSPESVITADCTFRFSYYDIEKIPGKA